MVQVKHIGGFSLFELALILLIAGILTLLAYPAYLNHLLQTRRADGQLALFELANRMENYFAKEHTYEDATLAAGKKTDVRNNTLSAEHWYLLAITSQTTNSYSLQATPRNAQAKDRACQTLTLNSLGQKGITNGPKGVPSGNILNCWT